MMVIEILTLDVEGSSLKWDVGIPNGCALREVRKRVLALMMRDDGLALGVSAGLIGEDPWIHASCSRACEVPSYDDLVYLKSAFFGKRKGAVIVLPEESRHVNIHPFCLHLYGPLFGDLPLPDFTMGTGSI